NAVPQVPASGATGSQAAAASPKKFTPDPNRPVPRDPHRLAADLARTTGDLRAAIDWWTTSGHPGRGQAPMRIQLLALYQQRMYRFLARHDATARQTLADVP